MNKQIRFATIGMIGSFGTLLLVSVPAFAQGKPTKQDLAMKAPGPEAREREARKACLEGDPAKGVSILSELFLDSKNATYIFNQGRCYEQNERYPEAIARFREYVRTPGSEEPAVAQKHIAECEELEAKKHPAPEAFAPPETPRVGAQPRPAATAKPWTADVPAADASGAGSGLRTAGIVIASVGVAGVVTGLLLNVKAQSLAKEIEPPNTFDAGEESTRKKYETFSWVGYGVGGAAIVTGAVLFGVGLSKGSSDQVALVPAIGSDFTGAALRGTF